MPFISDNRPQVQKYASPSPVSAANESLDFGRNGNSEVHVHGGICGTPGQRHRHRTHCDNTPRPNPPWSRVGNGRDQVQNFLSADL